MEMAGQLSVAVAVMPNGTDISLDGDLRLVKPALLYADRVTLYSPGAAILSLIQRSLDQGFDVADPDWLDHVEQTRPEAAEMAQTLRRLEALKQKPDPTPEEQYRLANYAQFKQAMEDTFQSEIVPEQEASLGSAGFAELRLAVEANLLTVDPIVTEADEYLGQALANRSMERLLHRLGGVLADGVAHPLFDDFVGNLVRAGVAEGRFQPVDIVDAWGRQVAMASQFMHDLPAFPYATVSEILDIRRHLYAPLIRFRSAIVELGKQVKSASYETGFLSEAEEIARARIEPALLEIEEEIRANAYLWQLIGHAVGDAKTFFGAVLGFGIAQTTDLPTMLGAASAAAVQASLAAAIEQRTEASRTSRHELYFLYRTNQLLS